MSTEQGAVYYPEDLSLLEEVLDQIMQSLQPKMRTRANLAEMAKSWPVQQQVSETPLELQLAARSTQRPLLEA
jgi:hypothetical protein